MILWFSIFGLPCIKQMYVQYVRFCETKSEDCSESRIRISVPGFPLCDWSYLFGMLAPPLPILTHQQLELGTNGKMPMLFSVSSSLAPKHLHPSALTESSLPLSYSFFSLISLLPLRILTGEEGRKK
jgi:hypothetical protein